MPSFCFEVEYAKSNRSTCKYCKGKIDKDLVRVGFKAEVPEDAEGSAAHMGCAWHHFACFAKAKGKAWFNKHLTVDTCEKVAGLDALKDEDRIAVLELFKACRGERDIPESPQPLVAAQTEKEKTPGGKKRKSKGDEDNATPVKSAKIEEPVLTEEQSAAIVEAKAKLSSKSVAWLGAALAKNGLPKAGRKEELVERIAENQVLGVPPICSVCEKKKLTWARATGKFSCPGFFDDEAKMFKRCKGPDKDAKIERSAWEELA